jgi:hypothetical protein
MKKLINYFIIGLFPISFLFSNPILLPQAFISELKFDENNKWILEINFWYDDPYQQQKYDSICIGTLNGFSRIKLDNIRDSTSLFVVTSDSLLTPLAINKDGDNIKLYSYLSTPYFTEPIIDSLVFGNNPGSNIDYLQTDYSIARLYYSDIFAKDKSPTIGFENDTVGTCGTLTGFIYDKNNNLLTSGNFMLENPIYFGDNGVFTTNIYARRVAFSGMLNNYKPNTYQGVKIDSIKLNVNPGSLYEKNIHILTDIVVGIEEKLKENIDLVSISNYPNPFNSTTNFAVKVPTELQSAAKEIIIYNIAGEKVYSINFKNDNQVSWDGDDRAGNPVSTGIYYYQFVVGNKVYKNGKMILLK